MRKITMRTIAFFLMVTLVFVPFAAAAATAGQPQSDDISAGAMTVDFLFVRPMGVFSVVFGTAIFIVSLPFSALGGNAGSAAKKLVADPFNYTFTRKLGYFQELKRGGY